MTKSLLLKAPGLGLTGQQHYIIDGQQRTNLYVTARNGEPLCYSAEIKITVEGEVSLFGPQIVEFEYTDPAVHTVTGSAVIGSIDTEWRNNKPYSRMELLVTNFEIEKDKEPKE